MKNPFGRVKKDKQPEVIYVSQDTDDTNRGILDVVTPEGFVLRSLSIREGSIYPDRPPIVSSEINENN